MSMRIQLTQVNLDVDIINILLCGSVCVTRHTLILYAGSD